MNEQVVLSNGKYCFRISKCGVLLCDRYEEPWRDFISDDAVLALFREAVKLRKALAGIARGDYDNAHDCKAAAKLATAALEDNANG